jgi:thioredoxin reductase
MEKLFDVIIIGGSYAGLSAAMTLGRSLRKTLVIDGGKPCNRFTPHSHNFLTQDGMVPGEIAAIGRQQVEAYKTVTFLEDFATNVTKEGSRFLVETQSGQTFEATRIILATGIIDLVPNIKGFAECWGKSIIHCPYCHGYEFSNKRTGILANAENTFHLAPLVRNLTKDLFIITNGNVHYTREETAKLKKHGIDIIEQKIIDVESTEGQLKKVLFDDGSKISLDALYVTLPFEQHSQIPAALGCEFSEKGYIVTDQFFKTTVEGVSACGDNTSPFRSVSNAVASGNFAAAAINRELAIEQF